MSTTAIDGIQMRGDSHIVSDNRMHHRGYTTRVVYSREDDVLIGCVEGISAIITWHAVDLVAFRASFMSAVDDYLQTCHDLRREPEVPIVTDIEIDALFDD